MVRGKHPEIQLVQDYTEDVAEQQDMKLPPRSLEEIVMMADSYMPHASKRGPY